MPSTSSSPVVAATTPTGKCGMQTPGGAGTYYAGVIYEAQSSLIAQSTANPQHQKRHGDPQRRRRWFRQRHPTRRCNSLPAEAHAFSTPPAERLRINGKATYPSPSGSMRPGGNRGAICDKPGHHGLYGRLRVSEFRLLHQTLQHGTRDGRHYITLAQPCEQMSTDWPS